MNPSLSLGLKASQQLAITPQMIQTLRVVQFSTPELLEHIQHELADNPFLTETGSEPSLDDDTHEIRDEAEHQHEYEDLEASAPSDLPSSPTDPDAPDRTSILERTASREQSLEEALHEQLDVAFTEGSAPWRFGEAIIGSLDPDGFFPPSTRQDLIAFLGCETEAFDEVWGIIRSFDPPGIASPDVRSCLLYQLETLPEFDTALELELVEKHFHELKQGRAAEIAKLVSAPVADVERALHHIATLEPRPARRYRSVETNLVIPDVVVRRENEGLSVLVNDEVLPKIAFSDEYSQIGKVKDNPELKQWIKEKEEKAHLLLSSIKFRSQNLAKVMSHLVTVQRAFFEKGPSALVPFTLVKLAELTGINQGTLSRITSTKYVDTEWGIFSLRVFFSSAVAGSEGEVSSNRIRDEIKKILEEFGSHAKLSDQKLAEVLSKKGFSVARRTVTKYRQQLQILSSFHR